MEQELIWKDPDNKKISFIDICEELVKTAIKCHNNKEELQIIVGTDSQPFFGNIRYVTVLCLYRVGKGGNYWYRTKNDENFISPKQFLKPRMIQEGMYSIEVATDIKELTGYQPELHFDVSPKESEHKTSVMAEQLRKMAASHGFESKNKPLSWVASCISDRHTK